MPDPIVPTPLVVDLSHHNANPDFVAAKAAGLVGVIHKASQGTGFTDSKYDSRRKAALKAGLLWGAYHFATGADPDAQVKQFIKSAAPDGTTLLALDFEANTQGSSMTLSQAKKFLKALEQQTGQHPKIYTGSFMFDTVGKKPDPDFAKYKLWWARYGASPEIHPTWSEFFLWQYTDGHSGPKPHQVNGIGFSDCDHFAGDGAALAALWVEKSA
jgi:lysozyme